MKAVYLPTILLTGSYYLFIVDTQNVNKTDTLSCTTPNGEIANCVSLYTCPTLLASLGSRDIKALQFVEESECGPWMVCCGTTGTFQSTTSIAIPTTTVNSGTKKYDLKDKESLLAGKKYCGLQHADDRLNYTNDGSIELDEFPWLVILRTDDENELIGCSATLITKQYVITSALCYNHSPNITTVHLGLYNRHNLSSCINYSKYDECTDPVLKVQIENVLVHEEFHEGRGMSPNIALIRLKEIIVYTDYIRPICLPFDWSERPRLGALLATSGWGPVDSNSPQVDIKKKLWHKITLRKGCPFVDFTICTLLENDSNLPCGNDFGGPLMYKYKHQWFLEGVLSASLGAACKNLTVSTRISSFMQWIIDNIKP